MILEKMKSIGEAYVGEPIANAIVTVPAYFNDSQRQATKDAGKIAGLEVLRIINEPTAAALAYGMGRKGHERIAVFDLGGGTYDISILDIDVDDNEEVVFEVLSTNGDGHLGGDDWDQSLIDFLADEFKKQEGVNLRSDAMALQRLKEAAEKAKCELSTMQETTVNLPFITATQEGPKHLQISITRARFEQICGDLFERLRSPVTRALADADLKPSDINEVVLVGGSTRMPKVQQIAKEIFSKEPNRALNPDEVVAIGAAIQAAVLDGDVKDVLLLDVTPLSLGLETLGGVMTALIERNATIPTSKNETFSTAADNQTEVTIHVLQGEREFSKDNRTLGRFNLKDIAPARRGTPQIEVEFVIDANGILSVTATDKATGKSQNIEIKGSSGLSDDEIERMKKDAEEHADDDKKQRELIDVRNQSDSTIYQIRQQLEEHGDKVPADVRGQIESAINDLESKIKEDNVDAIKRSLEELNNAAMDLGKAVYEQTSEQDAAQAAQDDAEPGGDEDEKKKEEDVIDAEYEVKE